MEVARITKRDPKSQGQTLHTSLRSLCSLQYVNIYALPRRSNGSELQTRMRVGRQRVDVKFVLGCGGWEEGDGRKGVTHKLESKGDLI